MISENIRRLCREKGITICQLERGIKIGNGTIRRWDNSPPSIDRVKKVSDYFGISLDALISGNWSCSIHGVAVIMEAESKIESAGFYSMDELSGILREWNVTSKDHVYVHIERGDGART